MSDGRPLTRSQNVVERLRQRILSGDLEPEEKLQEVALAESLGVSRTPVREALRILAEDGLLTYAPNRGYSVRRFSIRDVLIAFRVRASMEGLGCRLLAERGLTQAELSHLRSILAWGDRLLEDGAVSATEFSDWREMNRDFHVYLLRLADSRLLRKVARDAQTIPIVNAGTFQWYHQDEFRQAHDQHHRILEMLRTGQPDRAELWMREHILFAGEIARRALEPDG